MASKKRRSRHSRRSRSRAGSAQRNRHGNVSVPTAFIHEMSDILSKYGYDPKEAGRLAAEGMGPEELEHRIRTTESGGVGSLEYTHGLRKRRHLTASPQEVEIKDVLRGSELLPTLRNFYAAKGKQKQMWLRALDTLSVRQLDALAREASDYRTAPGIEMKNAIVDLLSRRRSQER